MPRFTGQSIERVEDPRFLTGADRFVSAVARPGMLHLAFVRSPHAHARILDVDVSAACAVPGVVAVLTATELDPFVSPQAVAGPPGLKTPQVRPLASDKVRYVGDPVALVVAETAGRSPPTGATSSWSTTSRSRAVVRMDDALDPGSPPLFEDLGDNLVFHDTSVWGPVDEVFERADLVVSRQLHPAPHQPRAARGARRRRRPTSRSPAGSSTRSRTSGRTRCARDVDAAGHPVRGHPRRRPRHRRRLRLEGPGHPRGRRAVRRREAARRGR